MQNNTQLILDQNFDSFSQLSDLAVGWGTEFRQLRAEHFQPEIFQGRVASLLLSNAKFGCEVDQRGTTPEGMRTFAVTNTNCSDIRWFGHNVDSDALLLFPLHGEMECVTHPGFDIFTFSVPVELLENVAWRGGLPETGKTLTSSEAVIHLSSRQIKPLRQLLRLAQALTRSPNEDPSGKEYAEDIQNQILLCTLELFSRNHTIASPLLKKKHLALRLVLEYIDAHKQRPLRVSELYSLTDVSPRSLQMLFKQELGMTLKTYLTGQRLYGVHRELWVASQTDTHVSDVARKWGFWHMSQFSRDYRKIFGELPSKTLARNA